MHLHLPVILKSPFPRTHRLQSLPYKLTPNLLRRSRPRLRTRPRTQPQIHSPAPAPHMFGADRNRLTWFGGKSPGHWAMTQKGLPNVPDPLIPKPHAVSPLCHPGGHSRIERSGRRNIPPYFISYNSKVCVVVTFWRNAMLTPSRVALIFIFSCLSHRVQVVVENILLSYCIMCSLRFVRLDAVFAVLYFSSSASVIRGVLHLTMLRLGVN